MKASMRARRMERNHRRMKKAETLTLVPIIDIFTMLLFFLMVNTGNVEVLDTDKAIKLPDSTSERRAEQTVLIKIRGTDVLIGEKVVAQLTDTQGADTQIPGLAQELQALNSAQPALTEREKEVGRAVTIMGDQTIPYHLLKRVMATCALNDFRDMALAVVPLEGSTATPGVGEGGA